MMRRGLWQQKQKRPSACLLCRYSYGFGPYTRPALRPSSSPDGRIIHVEPLAQTTLPPSGHSTRSFSVAARRGRHAGLETFANPRKPTRVGASAGSDGGNVFRRALSTGGLPSWATQQVEPAASDDGLLPHERAAREKAMSRKRPPPAAPAQDVPPAPAASDDALFPYERAAREKAMGRTRPPPATPAQDVPPAPAASVEGLFPYERSAREKAMGRTPPPTGTSPVKDVLLAGLEDLVPQSQPQPRPAPAPKNRGPAWASAAPSWSTPIARPSTGESGSGGPSQQADSLASLLPHERAARERAAARSQPQPAGTQPLLPHERAARERATGRTDLFTSDTLVPQDDMSRDYVSLQSRRRRPFGITGTPKDAQEDKPLQGRRDTAYRSEYPGARGEVREQAFAPSYDRPRPSSTLTQTPADEGDWKNLARRERNLPPIFKRQLPPGFSMSSPKPMSDRPPSSLGQTSQGSDSKTAADPWSRLERSASQTAAPQESPNDGVDQWALLQKNIAKQGKKERKKNVAANAATWDWTEEYGEEARVLKVQRIAREMQQGSEPAKETTASNAAPARKERDDRAGRVDRFTREERTDRREKPKKPRIRRRQEVDDNWDDDFYEEKRRKKAEKAARERQRLAALEAAGPTPIFLPEFISVSNLAIALGQKIDLFVRQLEELGFEEVSKDNILTGETAALVAQEYGFEPTVDAGEAEDLKPAPVPADFSSLPLRPPVVTIMGHVDHGKTTLLDYLRKSSIVAQEHGGITQHIGAFSVSMSTGKQITFLDTPGHAAFLSMRQRGASVTDMVILVVAADDSVMPQTLEALKHARAAKVPIIVAINKVDKPEANVERVKSDLAMNGVEIEDYGGDVQVVCVSGKSGQGMDDLEENILLLAEMLDIRAEPDGLAEGWVLESTIKPIGRVATVLVKRGTLRPGDFIVAGRVHAKIRSLRNEAGVEVDEAPPGTAVEILGWKEPPDAGDQVLQAPDESKAKAAVHYRQELKDRGELIAQMAQQEQDRQKRDVERERERALADAANPRGKKHHRHGHHHHNNNHAAPGEDAIPGAEDDPADTTQYLTFLVKGDVHGSVEAVTAALLEQGNNEIRAKVLVSAPGHITESDVEHAAVSGSSIINFNNAVPNHIKRLAGDAGVKILDHNVIYHLVEEVRDRLADALPPLVTKKVVGEAEVLQVFPINVKGRRYKNIAGCRIGNGYVKKGSKGRVIRGGENVYEGTIETLKHVKKDVQEMKKGSECGMSFGDWDELQAGDQIQIIEEYTEKRKL
ncbi:hypothetical protein C8A00DRAFT_19426 [Chaetomidium leptoderma]|uniref:Translation initiation factor IF-2, mitochondrial n=1 Tax=Chaetomidium leptoderma TaxID=669021 RepID=A0AAN6ZTW8_9PEZI|nr:hypothetical protein C8A00DRAFT_19426 [Chaetomidium leptoderma]